MNSIHKLYKRLDKAIAKVDNEQRKAEEARKAKLINKKGKS